MVKGHAFRKAWKEERKGTHKRSSHKLSVSQKKVEYDEKQKQKAILKEVQQMQQEMRDAANAKEKERRERLQKKKLRKEENELKAGQYQVITKTDKIRKWQKKAKKNLVKMSSENIEKILAKQQGRHQLSH